MGDGFAAALLLAGHGALYGVRWLGWVGAVVLVVGAGLAAASVRSRRWLPVGLVSAGLWGVVLVALGGSAFVLLDLISWVMNGAMLGRDGQSDWGPFAERLGFVVVAVLFLLTALAWRRHTAHSARAVAVTIRPTRLSPSNGRWCPRRIGCG